MDFSVPDETFLERFLVHCKNNLEKTKQKLDLYFTVRGVEKDYFANRNPFDPKIKPVSYTHLDVYKRQSNS